MPTTPEDDTIRSNNKVPFLGNGLGTTTPTITTAADASIPADPAIDPVPGHHLNPLQTQNNNGPQPNPTPRSILKRGSIASPRQQPTNGGPDIKSPTGSGTNRRTSYVLSQDSPRRSSLGRKLDSARQIDKQVSSGSGGDVRPSTDQPLEEGMVRLRTQRLARGGVYVHTCIGPIQVGIPPETIKDCLGSGMAVPRHYIVPAERFNRQLGNNMGINVAEFEFPAYMNKFFYNQSVNLIVDSKEVEDRIRTVFQETLFGPETINRDVDYTRDYPDGDKPDLPKELQYFRRYGDTTLTIDMFLSFTHFVHGEYY